MSEPIYFKQIVTGFYFYGGSGHLCGLDQEGRVYEWTHLGWKALTKRAPDDSVQS
jgi:hypothetical protein